MNIFNKLSVINLNLILFCHSQSLIDDTRKFISSSIILRWCIVSKIKPFIFKHNTFSPLTEHSKFNAV